MNLACDGAVGFGSGCCASFREQVKAFGWDGVRQPIGPGVEEVLVVLGAREEPVVGVEGLEVRKGVAFAFELVLGVCEQPDDVVRFVVPGRAAVSIPVGEAVHGLPGG